MIAYVEPVRGVSLICEVDSDKLGGALSAGGDLPQFPELRALIAFMERVGLVDVH